MIQIAEFDEAELACRLLEAAGGMTRPDGLSAIQALAVLEEKQKAMAMRMAKAAMAYFAEQVGGKEVPS